MKLKVYLSGEIHSDWRQQIIQGCQQKALNVVFVSANTDHASSDAAGDCAGQAVHHLARRNPSAHPVRGECLSAGLKHYIVESG